MLWWHLVEQMVLVSAEIDATGSRVRTYQMCISVNIRFQTLPQSAAEQSVLPPSVFQCFILWLFLLFEHSPNNCTDLMLTVKHTGNILRQQRWATSPATAIKKFWGKIPVNKTLSCSELKHWGGIQTADGVDCPCCLNMLLCRFGKVWKSFG